MAIYINEEDKKLFEQNGYNQESVGNTVNHYRGLGLSDDEIQGKINQRLESWRAPKQKVTTPVTYANQDLSNISPDGFKKNVDSLYDIPQVNMPDRNNAGYTNSDGEYLQPQYQPDGTPLLTGGVNLVKNIPQAVNNVNDFKNKYIQEPLTNVGRAIARPLLPKNIENRFLGSQEDEALLNKFNGVEFPSYEELSADYKSGNLTQEQYLQIMKDKLAVENARLDKNYRNWRNTEWGKEALLLALSVPAAAATAGGTAVAAPAAAATQIPRAAQLANLVKAASLTGLKEGAKFGAKYGLGASLIDKNANPITEPLKDAAEFGVVNAILNPVLQGTAGAIVGANKAFNVTGRMGEAVQKATEAIKKAPEEFKNRTNPNNWTKETVYEKNLFNNTFEPKERWQYKPQETPEPRNITPNIERITGEQTRAIANIAPKTVAKIAQEGYKPKTMPSGAPIEQSARAFSALPQNIINNSENKTVNKPKQYKVVDGKTVEVLEDGSYKELPNKYSKIAPNIIASKKARESAKNQRVENTENLQANETVGQEGNTYANIAPNIVADKQAKLEAKVKEKEHKELVNRAYAILAQASGKNIKYVRMTLNNKGKSKAAKTRAEKLMFKLQEPDDRISVDTSLLAGYEGYFGYPQEAGDDEKIVNRALQIIEGKNFTVDDAIEAHNAELDNAIAEAEEKINNIHKFIDDTNDLDELSTKFLDDYNVLEGYEKFVLPEEFEKLTNHYSAKYNELEYNKNKELSNNEQPRSITEDDGNGEQVQLSDRREETLEKRVSGNNEEGNVDGGEKQIALEGLEEESARAVQKQQDEVTAKENKDKYSTTQGGKQNQMFNTEQFKNGQQMLFDTSDMPKNEPEVKKTSVTMKSGKDKEIEYVEEIPEGYSKIEGATTAPLGYTWYTNGKSIGSGERKNILVKDKNAIVEESQSSNTVNNDNDYQLKTNSDQVKQKVSTSKGASKKKESKKLDDAGEFLQGNRKQDASLTWDELKDMNDLIRAKNTTKAKVYPKPTLEELEKEGFSEFQAGVILNVYNKINAKPAAGYDKIEHQKQYVDTINEVMSKVKDYIKSHPDEFTTDLIAEAAKKYRSWSYNYNKSLFDAIFPDTENKKNGYYSSIFRLYPEYNRKAIIVGGNKFTGALQLDNKTLADVMKAIEDSKKVKEKGEKVKKADWEKNFIVLEPDRWNKEYAVASKKSKQVLARYATKEDAIAAAERVHEKIERMKAESKKANFERDYIERRENNRDVTTEELQNAFGFRGVNFGNWATAKERQDFANYAYDSLFDLAELLNLPPKALSLNGQLGLAYGAQGTGGKKAAAAHYIPEYKDINLTKEYGAGSLAHEWWHALDNYFGNQATNKEYSREWALSLTKGGDLRPEVFEALENLQTQIKKAPFTEEDIKKRAEQLTKQTEARIKRYADSLKQNYAKAQNAAELHKIIDDLVENKEKYKTYSWEDLHEITNKFFKLLPSNRDTLTNRGEFSWFTREITRLNEIEELARKGANKTEYLQNAEKADKQEGGKYWSEDTELGARAFAAYIFDKMANQNIENRFLSRSGNGAILNLDAFKELAEGEERESLTLSTTPKGEERKRIFDAFDRLFKTIRTRETEKGVELYDEEFNPIKPITNLISNVNKYFETKEAIKSGSSFEDLSNNNEIFKAIREELENRTDYNGNTLFEHIKDYTFTDMVKADKTPNKYGLHVGRNKAIYINTEAIEALPQNEQTGRFINTVRHEIEHAIQEKLYNDIIETRGLKDSELKIFKSLAEELVKEKPSSNIISTLNSIINKIANKRNLRIYEVEALKDYAELKVVNKQKSEYYKKHKDLLTDYSNKILGKSNAEVKKIYNQLKPTERIIVDKFLRLFNNYKNAKYEFNARNVGENKAREVINANNGRNAIQFPRLRKQRNVRTGPQGGTPSEEYGEASEEFEGFRETKTAVNKNTGDEINKVVRDKVYDWHGNLESDRYDVDKSLNSFIQLTKHKAKKLSQKTGVKISDKQLREILPFLRERTGFPKSLDRDDLRNIFNKLSGEDKAELVKLADTISDKFEKYYTNYKDAKGEQTEESIENHISHIWDLDDKKKSLLTNYITTKSKFAKKRTIGTLVEGIDGIEINGEKVQFKPKTLDYAEILKSSSDNLIKSTHDSILANEIKNLRYHGEPMVLPAAKAPSEWIEVSHPALNKAVYMGSIGKDEIPMIIKNPVKVHPEIADYVKAIFEIQKPSKFWNTFDSLNGMIKQALLGFSGFHGYALSESSIGNAGVVKTLKESLNFVKFYKAIKNGDYDVYKNEEAAKRAIKAGVQLGTPSDLQRNLVEETLKKIPLVGKYVAGAVSANNKILWDVLHNNFKVLAFNTAIENLGGNVSKEQERAVAQWVNDSFGGQAWELLGIKKSSVKAASRILLSPDWNFSTIRQAAAAINSEWADDLFAQKGGKQIAKILGIGEESGSKGARGKIGRGFWIRSALFFTVFYNLMNAAFREKDRKENPNLYPDEMTPMDYSIWSNSYPMDDKYDRIMPKVFIGRNSDGTARMLRVGKQFREVPEFLTEPISKFGGKTAPIINVASQVGLGMSAGDAVNMWYGGEPYRNQDIWEGYGEDAERKEGLELVKGRANALWKSLVPYIGSKYIGGKHEFSAWDFVAQTNTGGSKSKVYKQVKEALKTGKPEVIEEIERKSYQDGVPYKDIESMVKYAQNDYKAENSKRYKKKLIKSFENADEKEYEKIRKKMTKKHLSEEEQRRIRDKAWEDYRKSK